MAVRLQDLETITPKDVAAALSRNETEELRLAPITIALSDLDLNFMQAVCIRLCGSSDAQVRGNALVALGHLARRFRSLDAREVKPLLEAALLDRDEGVRTLAKSAADEIHQFLHWRIKGHVYG